MQKFWHWASVFFTVILRRFFELIRGGEIDANNEWPACKCLLFVFVLGPSLYPKKLAGSPFPFDGWLNVTWKVSPIINLVLRGRERAWERGCPTMCHTAGLNVTSCFYHLEVFGRFFEFEAKYFKKSVREQIALKLRFRPHYAGEIWKRCFHSENGSNVFRAHYAREIWKYNNHRSFWICVWGILDQWNHKWLSWRHRFRKVPFSKRFFVHTTKPAFANSSGLFDILENSCKYFYQICLYGNEKKGNFHFLSPGSWLLRLERRKVRLQIVLSHYKRILAQHNH